MLVTALASIISMVLSGYFSDSSSFAKTELLKEEDKDFVISRNKISLPWARMLSKNSIYSYTETAVVETILSIFICSRINCFVASVQSSL